MVVVVVCGAVAVAVAVVMMVTITVAFGCDSCCWAVVRVMRRALRRIMVVVVVSILEIVRWSMMMMTSYNVMRV